MFFETYFRLLELEARYSTRTFSASEFTKLIRRQFPAADFSFRTHRDYAVDPNMVIVAGIYDCYNDAQSLPHTEITLCYHPEQETYSGHLFNWQQISFDIAECIGHETVHRQQYKNKAKLKSYESANSEQEYLGDESEIEAYGFSIAAESVVYNRPYAECTMFTVYKNTFDKDHSVIVKLQKQIVKYLEQLEPYHE
jgi:hypothetical protein